jgi:hypothetical protein
MFMQRLYIHCLFCSLVRLRAHRWYNVREQWIIQRWDEEKLTDLSLYSGIFVERIKCFWRDTVMIIQLAEVIRALL